MIFTTPVIFLKFSSLIVIRIQRDDVKANGDKFD